MPKIFIPNADAGTSLEQMGGQGAAAYAGQADLGNIQQKGIQGNAQIGVSIGDMLANHGQNTINQGLKLLQESKGAFEDWAYNKAMSAASMEYNQAVSARMAKQTDEKGNPTWPTLTQDITQIGQDIQSKYGAGLVSPEVASRFEQNFGQMQLNANMQSVSQSRSQQVNFAQTGLAEAVKTQSVNALADNNPANRDLYYNEAASAIDSGVKNGYITPQEAFSKKEEARKAIYYNSMLLTNEKDPNAVKQILSTHNPADLRLNAVEYSQLDKSNRIALHSLQIQQKESASAQQKVINDKQAIADDDMRLGIEQNKVDATQIQSSYEAGTISHKQYTNRMIQYDTKKSDNHSWSETSTAIANDISSGDSQAGKYTSKQIDRSYQESIDLQQGSGQKFNISDKANVAGRYSVPVPKFQQEVTGLMHTGTPDQLIESAKAFNAAVQKNPMLAQGMDAKTLSAINYANRHAEIGGDKGQIATYVKDNIFSTDKTVDRTQNFLTESAFDNKHIKDTVRGIVGANNHWFSKDDTISKDVSTLTQSLLKDAYNVSGDAQTAIDTVKAQMGAIVGTSGMNNNKDVMLLPPEKVYGVPPERLRQDLNSHIKDIIPAGEDPNSCNVEANHFTINSAGDKPTYSVYKIDATGQKQYLTDPKTGVKQLWYFDKNAAAQQDKVQREADVKAAEQKNFAGAGVTTLPTSDKSPAAIAATATEGKDIISLASSYVGLNETRDRDVLASTLAKCTGVRIDPSRTPWCAAFVNAILKSTGHSGTSTLRAADFMNYGNPTTTPNQGDIVVTQPLAKGASGHVGFFAGYVMKDGKRYVQILGGNQGDAVSVRTFPESVVRGYRQPPDAYDIKNASETVPEFRPETYMTSSNEPRGLRNNNPGNLRLTDQMWNGEVRGKDSSFKTFSSPEDGIRGIQTSISKKFARGLTSVTDIISSYAPSSENDTGAYINAVAKAMKVDPNARLDLNDRHIQSRMIAAIINHENGKNPFTLDHIYASIGGK